MYAARRNGTTYGNLHALLGHHLQAAHDVLLHLHELGQLLGEVGAEGAGRVPAQGMSYVFVLVGQAFSYRGLQGGRHVPRPPRPNRRPDFVLDGGGGGFCGAGTR